MHHVQATDAVQDGNTTETEELPLFRVGDACDGPILFRVLLDGKPVNMDLDTGAAVSVMGQEQQGTLFPDAILQPRKVMLRTYTTEHLVTVREVMVQVTHNGQSQILPLIIVQKNGPALSGRNCLAQLRLNWKMIAYSTANGTSLQQLLAQHQVFFQEGLGTFSGAKAHLALREGVTPVFHRPQPIPFAIQKAVEQELED